MIFSNNDFTPAMFTRFKTLMHAYINKQLKDTTITSLHTMYLMFIFCNKATTQAEITKSLGYNKANSSRVLSELESKKLIEKKQENKKFYYLLTLEGKKLAKQIDKIFTIWHERILSGIDTKEKEIFFKVSHQIMQNSKIACEQLKEESK